MSPAGTDPSPALSTRVQVARVAARAAAALARRVRGGSGNVIGGRVLLKAAPAAAAELSSARRVTLVSGTNGKTTTTGLLAAALGGDGLVGSNRGGANTSVGIAGTLAATHDTRMVLETDEGWLPWVITQTRPVSVLISNLSRDQLSRHHEVGSVSRAWRTALAGVPLAVANADDPFIVWAALAAEHQVWVAAHSAWTQDSLVCPKCGSRVLHEAAGWHCTGCDLRRPAPDYRLDGATLHGPDDEQVPLELGIPGRFNLGNAALAIATAHADGVPLADAARRVATVPAVSGRFEQVRRGDHDLRLMLAKNPAGWLELLVLMAPDRHPVVLCFNAEGVDGRDPSWLYDVSFTALRGRTVWVIGRRATDLLARLAVDGVGARRAPSGLLSVLPQLPAGPVDVVGNYTAFQAARGELGHRG
jgi:lipid II isoglutaminyl synthase (glutamine-hydrolysing)